jgi:hypothetical protein
MISTWSNQSNRWADPRVRQGESECWDWSNREGQWSRANPESQSQCARQRATCGGCGAFARDPGHHTIEVRQGASTLYMCTSMYIHQYIYIYQYIYIHQYIYTAICIRPCPILKGPAGAGAAREGICSLGQTSDEGSDV